MGGRRHDRRPPTGIRPAATVLRAVGASEATVSELSAGLVRITQPLPWALDHVHCYALVDGEGWTIVDTGLGTPGTVDRWSRVLAAHGDPQVAQIVVTHYHPDHLGCARALAELTGPGEVVQGALDARLSRLTWLELDASAFEAFLLGHGMPADLAAASASAEARMPVVPVEPTRTVVEGDLVSAGGVEFEVLHLPGHADGHIALLDRAAGRLFGGDVILANITPNIGRWEDTAYDPLGRYLATLARLEQLAPLTAYPGHHEPIVDVAARAQQLRSHHMHRLDAAESAVRSGARTTYEVTGRIWSTAAFSMHEQRFALVEGLAHLERLEVEGRIMQVEPGCWEPR